MVYALCVKHEVEHNFEVVDCQSDNRVLRKLSALISSSTAPSIIGIVIDADNPSLQGKWDSLRQRLSKEGYTVPDLPANEGTV